MYVSSRLKNNMLATKKSRKSVTLYEVKEQNNVDIILVLCVLSLVATLSMYFIDWFNLANVKNIVTLPFILVQSETYVLRYNSVCTLRNMNELNDLLC